VDLVVYGSRFLYKGWKHKLFHGIIYGELARGTVDNGNRGE
jgi:hypothetical protein